MDRSVIKYGGLMIPGPIDNRAPQYRGIEVKPMVYKG